MRRSRVTPTQLNIAIVDASAPTHIGSEAAHTVETDLGFLEDQVSLRLGDHTS